MILDYTTHNGNMYVNVTPHSINLKDEVTNEEFVIHPSGIVISATTEEEEVNVVEEVSYVKTTFKGNDTGRTSILDIKGSLKGWNVIIIGSIIAAQAYKGEVVAMTPCKGYERVHPSEKRMNARKFTIFS